MKKVIASILTIVLSIPLFVSTPLANAVSQSYTTGYGSYYFTYNNDLDTFLVTFGNLGGIYMKGYCQTLTYEFNDTYSGYLDIHLLSESIYMNATVITENCYVKGKNSSQWDYSIGFKDATSIKVTIVLPTMSTNNSWSGNKMALTTNYNITRDITTVEDYLDDIETTMGQIDAKLGTMATSLSNIYGVENASRQLLAEIEYAIRGNNSLYVLSDDMGTIIYDLNSIVSTVAQFKYNLVLNNVPLESMNAYLMFRSLGDLIIYKTDKLPYYNVTSEQHSSIKSYLYSDRTYYLSMRIYNPSNMNYWGQIRILDNNDNIQSYNTVYHDYYSNYSTVTLSFTPSSNGYYYVDLYTYIQGKSITPLYFGENIGLSQEMYSLTHIPNTTHNLLQGIIDAVRNMALNVNNLTVNATGITYNTNQTQVNNSVTNYNTNINQVYNVENNYGTQLDTKLQNYNPDNTSIISRLTASSNIMATVLNGINGIELFTVPISVMLVGIVLLAIVG